MMRKLFVLIGLLLAWAQGIAAPAFVAFSRNVAGSGTTVTVNHTAGAGSNMLAIIDVLWFDNTPPAISSVTYGGNAATLVRTEAHPNEARQQTARYYYKAPANSSQAVTVTFASSAVLSYLYVTTYSDVDQTTPLGTTAYAATNTTGPATVDVTSATGELVADFVTGLMSSVTVGAGQTNNVSNNDPGGNGFSLGSSTEAGATTTTMSWTLGSATRWAIYGSPLKPVSASSGLLSRRRRN